MIHETPIEIQYDHAAAVAFVEECERNRIRILGMDVLRREPGRITPMNATNWEGIGVEGSWHEARSLLQVRRRRWTTPPAVAVER